MERFQYRDIQTNEERHLALTSLTAEEFALLLPPFEEAFSAHMDEWCLDGSPRTGRRYSTYKNCPLPTAEERFVFIVMYLKTNPLQEAHGLLFKLPQGKTNMWIHTLLPVLRNTLRMLGDAPTRNLRALAERLAALTAATTDTGEMAESEVVAAPLFATTVPSDASHAPKTLMNRKAAIVERRNTIQ